MPDAQPRHFAEPWPGSAHDLVWSHPWWFQSWKKTFHKQVIKQWTRELYICILYIYIDYPIFENVYTLLNSKLFWLKSWDYRFQMCKSMQLGRLMPSEKSRINHSWSSSLCNNRPPHLLLDRFQTSRPLQIQRWTVAMTIASCKTAKSSLPLWPFVLMSDRA